MKRAVYPTTKEESIEFKQFLTDALGLPLEAFPEHSYGYGIKDGDEIVFAAVLEAFHIIGDILMHFVGSDPSVFFNRKLVTEVITLPFRDPINARRMTLIVDASIPRWTRVAQIFGFEEEGRMKRHFGDGEDGEAILLGFLRPDMEA